MIDSPTIRADDIILQCMCIVSVTILHVVIIKKRGGLAMAKYGQAVKHILRQSKVAIENPR